MNALAKLEPSADGDSQIIPLTDEERELRTHLEAQVDTGIDALWEIRELNLYRDYGTFEAYCASRWGNDTVRRKNQRLAGLRVFGLLHDALASESMPAETPLPQTEYTIRPIAGLAGIDPQKAVEVYVKAVENAHGAVPSHSQVLSARDELLSKKEQAMEDARRQLEASPYRHLVEELRAGGDAIRLLALADALNSCAAEVRRHMVINDIHDTSLIRMINDQYVQKNEHVVEVFRSRTLQYSDGTSIRLEVATAKDYRKFLDQRYREHLNEVRDKKRGEPISIVAFYGDPEGTLESLLPVLGYVGVLALGNLISQI